MPTLGLGMPRHRGVVSPRVRLDVFRGDPLTRFAQFLLVHNGVVNRVRSAADRVVAVATPVSKDLRFGGSLPLTSCEYFVERDGRSDRSAHGQGNNPRRK